MYITLKIILVFSFFFIYTYIKNNSAHSAKFYKLRASITIIDYTSIMFNRLIIDFITSRIPLVRNPLNLTGDGNTGPKCLLYTDSRVDAHKTYYCYNYIYLFIKF